MNQKVEFSIKKANHARNILLKFIDKEIKERKEQKREPTTPRKNNQTEYLVQFNEFYSSAYGTLKEEGSYKKSLKETSPESKNTEASSEKSDLKKILSSTGSKISLIRELQRENYLYLKKYSNSLKLRKPVTEHHKGTTTFYTYTCSQMSRLIDIIQQSSQKTESKKRVAYSNNKLLTMD